MIQLGLVSIGAGTAAALLIASVTSGTLLSVPLFYLASLPIMIAAIGWSHWAGLIAAVLAALALSITFDSTLFIPFLSAVGAPAWWLSYLAMLARPLPSHPGASGSINNAGTDRGGVGLEWYPPGRLVVWSALLAALIVASAIPKFGFDTQSFHAGLREALTRVLPVDTRQLDTGATSAGVINSQHLLDIFVEVLPPAAAAVATFTGLLNLWLAARVVKLSGRLARPWPSLSTMTFPAPVSILLVAAMALSFAGGLLGIVGGVLSASLLTAYSVLGFAVVHEITRGIGGRPFLLAGVYAVVLTLGSPILLLCLLGLVDATFGLRERVMTKRGPS